MVANPKPVGSSDFIADFDDLFAGELDQFPALGTVQMVVFGISIVEFIHASAVEFEAVKPDDESLTGTFVPAVPHKVGAGPFTNNDIRPGHELLAHGRIMAGQRVPVVNAQVHVGQC